MTTFTDRPVPVRLAVMKKLEELLEGISVANGDAHDLANRVYRNRVLIGADISEDPPAIALVEAPRPDVAAFAGEQNEGRSDSLTIMIQGIAVDDRRTASDNVYYLCQDVEKRLARIASVKQGSGSPRYPEHHLLGGMITSVEIAPPVIRPPEAGIANNAFFYIAIRLGLAGKIGES